MIRARHIIVLFSLILLTACNENSDSPSDNTVLARYDDVSMTAEDLTSAQRALLGNLPADQRVDRLEQWLGEIAFRRLINDSSEVESQPESNQINMAANAWLNANLKEQPVVSAQQIEEYFAEHQHLYSTVEQRHVSHIFRSDNAEGDAIEQLRQGRLTLTSLKTFAELARELSESENASLGGQIGWIARGQLGEDAETAIFALSVGDTSDPIAVPGGYAIFHLNDQVPARTADLSDMRQPLRDMLLRVALIETTDELLAYEPSPENFWQAESAEELFGMLRTPDSPAVLVAGNMTLDGVQLGEIVQPIVGGGLDPRTPPLPKSTEQLWWDIYRLTANRFHAAWLHDQDTGIMQKSLDQSAWITAVEKLLDQQVAEMSLTQLKPFYDANAHLFVEPEHYRVKMAVLPVVDVFDAAETSLAANRALASSDNPEEALGELGFKLTDHGWQTEQWLATSAPKLPHYFAQAKKSGHSPVFQSNDQLVAMIITDRRPAQQLSLETAHEAVKLEYRQRMAKPLYQTLVESTLEAHGFSTYPDELKHLAEPARPEARKEPDV